MKDLRVERIALVRRPAPVYYPAAVFAGDPYLEQMAASVRSGTAHLPVDADDLRYLLDEPGNDVAEQALELLGPPEGPQPLYLSRSGPDPDPFVVMLARLLHGRDWVRDASVLTHLGDRTATAVFDLLTWLPGGFTASVLLVDQQTTAPASALPPALTAIALRTGPDGARVHASGTGLPPAEAGATVFTGTRSGDAWAAFTGAVTAGSVRAGEKIVLHTAGPTGNSWVTLDLDRMPVVRERTAP